MAKRRAKRVTKDVKDKKKSFKDPDPNSKDFIYDEVDQFHMQKEKIMLDAAPEADEAEDDIDEEEEVLGLETDDEDTDEDDVVYEVEDADAVGESDNGSEDEEDEEQGLPSDKAWGRSKKAYYDADVDDQDLDASDEETKKALELEEKEAMTLQKRLEEKLDLDDFQAFERYESPEAHQAKQEQREQVLKDLSKLSKREKLEILAKDSPELLGLVDDFREKLTQVWEVYHPLLLMTHQGLVTSEQGATYIKIKHTLLLNYCVNISFYLLLKASKESVKNHPVIEKIFLHKQLLKKLEPYDEQLESEVQDLLAKWKKNNSRMTEPKSGADSSDEKEPCVTSAVPMQEPAVKKRVADQSNTSEFAIDPLVYYHQIKSAQSAAKRVKKETQGVGDVHESADGALDEGEKRGITYEMEKNKGLTRRRRKELRNPRLRHKMKYKKAKLRHKGQVREVVVDVPRYGGERTGIKANLSRSVKLKS